MPVQPLVLCDCFMTAYTMLSRSMPYWIKLDCFNDDGSSWDHDIGLIEQCEAWCAERFGPSALERVTIAGEHQYAVNKARRWAGFNDSFGFNHVEAAIEFKLRWR